MSDDKRKKKEKKVSGRSMIMEVQAKLIEECKGRGFDFDTLLTRALADHRTNPEKYAVHIAGLIKSMCAEIWNHEPKSRRDIAVQTSMFTINGFDPGEMFKFSDPDTGGVLKVGSAYATVGQWAGKRDLARKNLDIQESAFAKLDAAVELALERANYDYGVSMVDVADDTDRRGRL